MALPFIVLVACIAQEHMIQRCGTVSFLSVTIWDLVLLLHYMIIIPDATIRIKCGKYKAQLVVSFSNSPTAETHFRPSKCESCSTNHGGFAKGVHMKTDAGGPLERKIEPEEAGGFTQTVQIYKNYLPGTFWPGTVLIDPGNEGPNLITEEVLQYLNEPPTGPGILIRAFDGNERMTGGEVRLWFSGPDPHNRRHRETFSQVPHITDGIDMVLNLDFYVKVFPDKVPSMLMIRSGKGKETQGDEESQRERERRREERARRQEAERREQRRANEAERLARNTGDYYSSHRKSSG